MSGRIKPGLLVSRINLWNAASSSSSFSTSRIRHTVKRRSTYYYDVLGLTPKATHKQIKAAFYELSKTYHPDGQSDTVSTEKFHELCEAYEILGSSFSRKKYDRGLISPLNGKHSEHAGGDSSAYDFAGFRPASSDESDRTAFKPGRFKKRNSNITTGRTKHYNFDEYYSQHYGEQVLQQFKKRQASGKTTFLQQSTDEVKSEFEAQSTSDKLFMLVGLTVAAAVLVMMVNTDLVRELEATPACKNDTSNNKP